MIDFSALQGLTIPEGVVKQIKDASGNVLWNAVSKVKWQKYNCTYTSKWTQSQPNTTVGRTIKVNFGNSLTTYQTTSFSSSAGLSGSSARNTSITSSSTKSSVSNAILGRYYLEQKETEHNAIYISQVVNYSKQSIYANIMIQGSVKNKATKTTTYKKGSTSYGTLQADEGTVPEGGTLCDGSLDGSYCVAKVGSTYYYYVKA